jgi:hypothetical protein
VEKENADTIFDAPPAKDIFPNLLLGNINIQ